MQKKKTLVAEKGTLKREDFNHIQKIIALYSDLMAYEKRIQNQGERLEYLDKKDYQKYIGEIHT